MQLVTRVETTTGKKLALRALYENPTLEALARAFAASEDRAEPTTTIVRVDRSAGRRK